MHKFQAAFSRRKSNPAELHNAQQSPEKPSFRVLERTQPADGRIFDGGAKMSRASGSGSSGHKPRNSELEEEGNMFAGLNPNRGSGASNNTKFTATSTDTSSRHSNVSTAPSSADNTNFHDDRGVNRNKGQLPKSGSSSFLDRASRTFSFGTAKKNQIPPPKQDINQDVPPIPRIHHEDEFGRERAMTASTTSTATPKFENLSSGESSPLNMGDDFGSMFSGSSIDKRASTSTIKNFAATGQSYQTQRQGQPAPLNLDYSSKIEPAPGSWNGSYYSADLLSPDATSAAALSPAALSPAVQSPAALSPADARSPRHQPSFEYRSPHSPGGMFEDDDDARLVAEHLAAARSFGAMSPGVSPAPSPNIAQTAKLTGQGRPAASSNARNQNSYGNNSQGQTGPSRASVPKPTGPNKVMTPAQFERYQKEKEKEGRLKRENNQATDSDDEDEINYDDDEDEEEKLKREAKQRREQQQSMLEYRRNHMKTSGDNRSTSPLPPSRPGLASSLSAPQMFYGKASSPELPRHIPDEDEDEDVPLALIQNRAGSRLSTAGSQPNMRASMLLHPGQQPGRPVSGLYVEPVSGVEKRRSFVPAFARGLPTDPFSSGGAARSPGREAMAMGGGTLMQGQQGPQQRQQAAMGGGGLVGIIAREELQRELRRPSPKFGDNRRLTGAFNGVPGVSLGNGYPNQSMNMGQQGMQGMQGMGRMPQQQMHAGDQANQLSEHMSQFMQVQMQWMQMQQMLQANNMSPQQQQQMMIMQQQVQQGGMMPQQRISPQIPQGGMPQLPQLNFGGIAGNQSVTNFSSGQPVMGGQLRQQPGRTDTGMRTMSMVQPTSPYLGHFGASAPGPGPGYTPSIAPSERSNIGLPGRYRPVSQAGSVANHHRSQSFSAALTLSHMEPAKGKGKSTVRVVGKSNSYESSDDDDESAWAAMRAKREQKKLSKK